MKKLILILTPMLAVACVMAHPKTASLSASVWDSVSGFIVPSVTTPASDAPISIRQSDGSIWIGADTWRDLPLTDAGIHPFATASMVNRGGPISGSFFLSILSDENYDYFSQANGNAFHDSMQGTATLGISSYTPGDAATTGVTLQVRSGAAVDPSIPAIEYRDNSGSVAFAVWPSDGAMSAGGGSKWKFGGYSSGTITVTIDGQQYAITATPIP